MNGRTIAAIAIAIPTVVGGAKGCADTHQWRRPAVVTYLETATVPNVEPPTRLDIVMTPNGDIAARCADMGGELHNYGDVDICQGVDY